MGSIAIERFKYRAINSRGRPIRGVISAANEADLYIQLQSAGLELIDCKAISTKVKTIGFGKSKVTTRDLIQFFSNMEQMQSAGVPLLDSLSDIRDTTENTGFRDVLSEVHRSVAEGMPMSEAMSQHPKIFKNIYVSLIKAGEDTGDLTSIYRQLVKYLKWVDDMQSKVRKATRYPMILICVVILTVVVMMGLVVPQVVGFLKNMDIELPFYTKALIMTSDFFSGPLFTLFGIPFYGGLVVVLLPILLVVGLRAGTKMSDDFAYRVDLMVLNTPILGPITRKITISRYAQTFGALFSSGIDVIGSLQSARKTVTNKALIDALETVEGYVQAGSPLSEAFNASGEFPTLVIRMLKIGEESGGLAQVLDQVAEFYTKDVDEAVQGLITMIEPALTGILGGMILWIAAGVFGPIYGSFSEIDF